MTGNHHVPGDRQRRVFLEAQDAQGLSYRQRRMTLAPRVEPERDAGRRVSVEMRDLSGTRAVLALQQQREKLVRLAQEERIFTRRERQLIEHRKPSLAEE